MDDDEPIDLDEEAKAKQLAIIRQNELTLALLNKEHRKLKLKQVTDHGEEKQTEESTQSDRKSTKERESKASGRKDS